MGSSSSAGSCLRHNPPQTLAIRMSSRLRQAEYSQRMTALTVEGLVPYAHVADLTRSIRFYRRLGFKVESTADHEGQLAWASLRCGKARLMIALATAPVDPERQAVLFYVHAKNVAGIREQLLDSGIEISEIR